MKALLFAAGLGTRLRPLTEHTPKPLLPVGGKPMLQWHIERLVAAGVSDLIINSAWLAEQIDQFVGDGRRFGVPVTVSHEPGGPYDTGGAIRHCRSQLGNDPFLVVAGDIWTTFPFADLTTLQLNGALGCLVMVNNPAQHPTGDFRLHEDGRLTRLEGGNWFTYSGIALLSPAVVDGCDEQVFPLREPLRAAASAGRLRGLVWQGEWEDVGTVERYNALNKRLDAQG